VARAGLSRRLGFRLRATQQEGNDEPNRVGGFHSGSVFAREPKWAELVDRLPASELLPTDEKLLRRTKSQLAEGR
jgi:hypothetical protein